MADRRQQVLVALAWPDGDPHPPSLAGWSDAGWRVEPVLADQGALDRAGSKGRTPPPVQTVLWHDVAPGGPAGVLVPDGLPDRAARWTALRVADHPAWDDTITRGVVPQVKQVSFLKAQTGLAGAAFRRHFREHVAVARVHHPAICRYEQHDVLDATGDGGLDTHGVSELWFADEDDLAARYFAGPGSVPIVRADNREYIDFSGTLSLLVRPDDRRGAT
jgi:hypothetical protein